MTSQEYCKIAVAALEDRKAEDVKIIDIREISPVADYFVIADGTNQNQIHKQNQHQLFCLSNSISIHQTLTWS